MEALMIRACVVAVLALPALSACVPMHAYETPAVQATVVDARTQAPISGARVTVIAHRTQAQSAAVTDASGRAAPEPLRFRIVSIVIRDRSISWTRFASMPAVTKRTT
jgi:hypothetical protein